MTRVGVVFRPQCPPEQLIAAARAAEQHGLDELWLWEDCFLQSGVATAVAALGATEQLTVAVGLFPVPLRNVALTAMEIATVARLFPGRFTAGVGHGVLDWMEQVGARVPSPMTLMREYVEVLGRLLTGEKVSYSGRFVSVRDVQLGWPPHQVPPLVVGAVGPRTLQLSGELADGTVLTSGMTPDEVAAACEQISAGRARSTRPDHEVAFYLPVAFGEQAATRMTAEHHRWGWAEDADVSLTGDPASVAAGARRWVDAGATTIVLQAVADEDDMPGFIADAGQVARLLRG